MPDLAIRLSVAAIGLAGAGGAAGAILYQGSDHTATAAPLSRCLSVDELARRGVTLTAVSPSDVGATVSEDAAVQAVETLYQQSACDVALVRIHTTSSSSPDQVFWVVAVAPSGGFTYQGHTYGWSAALVDPHSGKVVFALSG